jgi:hypothetical protein
MKIEKIICDHCGRIKDESNHWYRVQSGRNGFHLYSSDADPTDDDLQDYCSDNCVMIVISQFMNKKPIEDDEIEQIVNEFEREAFPDDNIPF